MKKSPEKVLGSKSNSALSKKKDQLKLLEMRWIVPSPHISRAEQEDIFYLLEEIHQSRADLKVANNVIEMLSYELSFAYGHGTKTGHN